MFENYTASFEIDTQRIELSLWDTSGNYAPPSPLLSASPQGVTARGFLVNVSGRVQSVQVACTEALPCGHAQVFPSKRPNHGTQRGSGFAFFLSNEMNL